MKRLFLLIAAAFVLLLAPAHFSGAFAQDAQPDDPVVNFGEDDADMNAAIDDAREGLAHFWQVMAAHDDYEYGLKVAFRMRHGGWEHIWLSDVRRDGGIVSGVVANYPADVPQIQFGQRVNVSDDNISDWSIMTPDGGQYGHYTTRIVLRSLSSAEREDYAYFIASLRDGFPN